MFVQMYLDKHNSLINNKVLHCMLG